jgi:DNA adenine methylase
MDKKVKPIIKWTGGKYREFALFKEYVPSFERYIEPFFGGGGVFFALQPKTPCLINDKSGDLIQFYRQLAHPEFKQDLYQYADAWEAMTKAALVLWGKYEKKFANVINGLDTVSIFAKSFLKDIEETFSTYPILTDDNFTINTSLFVKRLEASLIDKVSRIYTISKKEGRVFNARELFDHFETGLKSGMYLYFRSLMNSHIKLAIFTESKAAANWYFVRELCYASMFRFNAKGDFNIPYGGIAYNRKKVRNKINLIFSDPVQELFERTNISNLDFEEMLTISDLKPSDFVFVDPPYDSEFSEYDKNAFTQHDQQRLANFLIACKAKWMVVIKETTFIRNIYTHPGVKIVTFGKKYTYNMRGRNNRKVTHLIITNY